MESSSANYEFEKDLKWRTTINDAALPFTNFNPGIVENTAEELKKQEKAEDKYALSEGNVFKVLKTDIDVGLVTGKIVFYKAKDSLFKVNEVGKNDEGKVTKVVLLDEKSNKSITLDSSSEIDTLRDYIFMTIKFFGDGMPILNVAAGLNKQLSKTIEDTIRASTGKAASSFKFFANKSLIAKDCLVKNIVGVEDGMTLIATVGYSEEHTFVRFQLEEYMSPYWSSYPMYTDALIFIPSQTVFLSAFDLFR